jgi:hypothetical protein
MGAPGVIPDTVTLSVAPAALGAGVPISVPMAKLLSVIGCVELRSW